MHSKVYVPLNKHHCKSSLGGWLPYHHREDGTVHLIFSDRTDVLYIETSGLGVLTGLTDGYKLDGNNKQKCYEKVNCVHSGHAKRSYTLHLAGVEIWSQIS